MRWLKSCVLGPPTTNAERAVFIVVRVQVFWWAGWSVRDAPALVQLLFGLLLLFYVSGTIVQLRPVLPSKARCEICGTTAGVVMMPRDPHNLPPVWALFIPHKDRVFLCVEHFPTWIRLKVYEHGEE